MTGLTFADFRRAVRRTLALRGFRVPRRTLLFTMWMDGLAPEDAARAIEGRRA